MPNYEPCGPKITKERIATVVECLRGCADRIEQRASKAEVTIERDVRFEEIVTRNGPASTERDTGWREVIIKWYEPVAIQEADNSR